MKLPFLALALLSLGIGICAVSATANAASHQKNEVLVRPVLNIGNTAFYHGDTFRFDTLTLGDLKSYCAHLSALSKTWHLANDVELQPILQYIARVPDGPWADFSHVDPKGPGYILVTAGEEHTGDIYYPHVYRLYGNVTSPQLNYLGLGTINVRGSDLDSIPLTDNSGNSAQLKVICVSSGP